MARPLKINLVPAPLWNKNLAHVLPNWTEVRNKVCSCGCCAICDTQTTMLHAHEVWKYDDDNHMVDLDDIIPVCENCHMTLHFGKSDVKTWLDKWALERGIVTQAKVELFNMR